MHAHSAARIEATTRGDDSRAARGEPLRCPFRQRRCERTRGPKVDRVVSGVDNRDRRQAPRGHARRRARRDNHPGACRGSAHVRETSACRGEACAHAEVNGGCPVGRIRRSRCLGRGWSAALPIPAHRSGCRPSTGGLEVPAGSARCSATCTAARTECQPLRDVHECNTLTGFLVALRPDSAF
jgi:hypothetical protein